MTSAQAPTEIIAADRWEPGSDFEGDALPERHVPTPPLLSTVEAPVRKRTADAVEARHESRALTPPLLTAMEAPVRRSAMREPESDALRERRDPMAALAETLVEAPVAGRPAGSTERVRVRLGSGLALTVVRADNGEASDRLGLMLSLLCLCLSVLVPLLSVAAPVKGFWPRGFLRVIL